MDDRLELLKDIGPGELRILDGDDWVEIYGDSGLIYEGHPNLWPILDAVWGDITKIVVFYDEDGTLVKRQTHAA